jgi:hypothetical protein
MKISRRTALIGAASSFGLLAACGGGGSTFRTYYPAGVPADVARGWRVVDVAVSVPESLVVSEAKTLLPRADIVWREDPATGDRHAQVAVIMKTAIQQGASGLRGGRPVRLSVVVSKFHALTFEAETRVENAGVHNVDFTIQVTDAASGAVLAGPEKIEAAFPALAGAQMAAARAQGQTQKSMIISHVRQTVAGWLGTGPDIRNSFSRQGG